MHGDIAERYERMIGPKDPMYEELVKALRPTPASSSEPGSSPNSAMEDGDDRKGSDDDSDGWGGPYDDVNPDDYPVPPEDDPYADEA